MASSVETEVYSARNEFVDMIVPIDSVKPSPLNPRRQIDDASLQELAASIREVGLLEPIVVRPIGGTGVTGLSYHIVAGERRWRACKMAGLRDVPVRILDGLDDAAALKLALLENLQRQDLDPLEEAEGYRRLAQLGHRQKEIGELVGKSQPAVANSLRLLELPASVQEKIRSGRLTTSHGVALASYRVNSHVQEALADLAVKEGWPAKKLEGYFASTSWLPDGSDLKKYVYELRNELWDWKTECQGRCPHDAFRTAYNNWWGWCLRPACYEQKRAAAEAERKEAVERRIQEARQAGKTMVKLADLPWNSYQRIESYSGTPAGCQADCEKRIHALDHGDSQVEICTDPKCWKRLERNQTRALNKAGRERMEILLAEVKRAVDSLEVVGPREMAILAWLTIGNDWRYSGKPLEKACMRHGRPELFKLLKDDAGSYWRNRRRQLQDLAAVEPVVLARVLIEAGLRNELTQRYEDRLKSDSPITEWYLGIEAESPANGEPSAGGPIAAMAESPATPTGYFDGSDGEELTREEEQGV